MSDRQELPLPTGHAHVGEDLLQLLEALQEAIFDYQVRSQPQAGALLNINGESRWCNKQRLVVRNLH